MKKSKVFKNHHRALVLDFILWCLHDVWRTKKMKMISLRQLQLGINDRVEIEEARIDREGVLNNFLDIVNVKSYLTPNDLSILGINKGCGLFEIKDILYGSLIHDVKLDFLNLINSLNKVEKSRFGFQDEMFVEPNISDIKRIGIRKKVK